MPSISQELVPAGWQSAKLPGLYHQAKRILAECESIDECRQWNAKAEAIASYYRPANDPVLVDIAKRIQLRAWRRIGELLNIADLTLEIEREPSAPGAPRQGGSTLGKEAGLKRRQMTMARAIGRLDEKSFEKSVERPRPPSLHALYKPGSRQRRTRDQLVGYRFVKVVRQLDAILTRHFVVACKEATGISDIISSVREALGRLP